MDDQLTEPGLNPNFAFLNFRDVQAHFADLNIALLGGRHIQTGEGYYFTLVNSYPADFKHFYQTLYGLDLKQGRAENIDYYYLDFPEESNGRLNTTDRFREMTPWEMLFALMLLNMYYDRFFEQSKELSWQVVRKEIEEGELAPLYRKAFINSASRETFSDQEIKNVFDHFKRVLRTFDRWGWVKIIQAEDADGDVVFLIRESIDRFGKLYNYEISEFDSFISQIDQKRARA
jgi:hypothetical protein